jgi:polar amino acid transport system substrate-binding protein
MPYNGDPTAEKPGYVVEVAKAIFEAQGIILDYQTVPWTKALESARAGTSDGVIGAGPADLEGLIAPAEAIGEPQFVILTAKNSDWKWVNIGSLKTIRLGVIYAYTYWDALDTYIKDASPASVIRFSSDTPLVDALNQLKAGRIDAVPEAISVFVWTVKEMKLSPSDFRIAYKQQGDPMYVAFSKNEKGIRFAKIFDEGIRKLRASGELTTILKKYSASDWK